MLGKLLGTPEIDKFADWIVGEIKKALPAGFDPSVKNIAQRAEKLNKLIDKQTQGFCQSNKLSIYKKARLAARVREGMRAQGYGEAFIKSFSLDLLTRIQAISNNKR